MRRLPIADVSLDALVAGARSRWCWSAAVLCFVAWRRSGYRAVDRASGSSCGSAASALVAVLLNQPEWVEEYRPEEKPVGRRALGRVTEHGHA